MRSLESPPTVRCARCRAEVRPLAIVYGYPTHETFEAAARGELRLGGCIVEPESPAFTCPRCDAPFPFLADPASGEPVVPEWWRP